MVGALFAAIVPGIGATPVAVPPPAVPSAPAVPTAPPVPVTGTAPVTDGNPKVPRLAPETLGAPVTESGLVVTVVLGAVVTAANEPGGGANVPGLSSGEVENV